ncbi:MAG: von Willebrand factor type A domain-containing protein [Archangium sp.]|nr:von Willebrand factor type A domain-containing protein [Archangium sp.]
MKMTNSWMKWVTGSWLTAVVVLAGLSLFGDNLRRLFGASANGLAGDTLVTPATPTFRAAGLDTKKSLKAFGASEYGGAGYAPAPPQPTAAPNQLVTADHDALSTFAIDVDTASYTYARRQLQGGLRVEPSTVRVEEWVNAFRYHLEAPKNAPWAIHAEGAPSPFTAGRTLLKVSLQGRRFGNDERKPANLVFLVDTSGSMTGPDRLELAKQSMHLLVDGLDERDTVAIATYAGETSLRLRATNADEKGVIHRVIDGLSSGGGTAMESGMVLAYREAVKGVRPGVESRVLVFTDGDANIGATSPATILSSVQNFVHDGVTLTTVGFGMGNYRDHALEQLADKGNGQSLYIDSAAELERVFGQSNLPSLLQVISKDVKVQVAFDQQVVRRYRLLGYENRDVRDEDFRNDAVDGGELHAGHTVTALYELELTGNAGALGTISVRGKQPANEQPFELATRVPQSVLARTVNEATADFRFATAVAMAADVLRGNAHAGVSLREAKALAETAASDWPERREFVSLLNRALSGEGLVNAPSASNYQY